MPRIPLVLALLAGLALLPACRDETPATGAAASAPATSEAIALPPNDAARAEAALAAFLTEQEVQETPVHRDAFVDLDGDGTDDLLMYLEDPNWCGSGGCTLLVFHGEADGFRLVTQASAAQPPIAVAAQTHGGWRDLLVDVGGGGLQPGTVALQHDGIGYPEDPTLMASLATDMIPQAEVVID